MRPGSNTAGIKPADANTARNMPAVKRNAAIAACTWRTSNWTFSPRDVLPNSEMVAMAPWTTSTFMMNMKNRISAVEHPKNAQKIFRAKASRNVSRTSAAVTSSDLILIHRPHENILQRAASSRQFFNLAVLSAQQIDRLVGLFAASEKKFDAAVALGDGFGSGSQFLIDALGHVVDGHAVAAAGGEIFHLSLERYFSTMNDGHIPAEQLHLSQKVRVDENRDALLFERM